MALPFFKKLSGYRPPGERDGNDDDVNPDGGCCFHLTQRLSSIGSTVKQFYLRFRARSASYQIISVTLLWVLMIIPLTLFVYRPRLLDYKLYFPVAKDPIFSSLNKTAYLVWIGAKPLRAVGLATIDSIARHSPDWRIEVHFTREVALPDDIFATQKKNIETQMNFFRQRGVKIEAIIHENIEKELEGTLFDGIGIKQQHVGGVYSMDHNWMFPPHASDLLRVLIPIEKGGMYLDEDNLLIADLQPLLERYGPTIMGPDMPGVRAEVCSDFEPQTGFFTLTANHPLFLDIVQRIRTVIKEQGADCIFPYRRDAHREECHWVVIGKTAFADAHTSFCENNPPEVVNPGEILDELLPTHISYSAMNSSTVFMAPTSPPAQRHTSLDRPRHPYSIITREYLIPGFESDFLLATDEQMIATRFEQLSISYMFHIFGETKDQWLSRLLKGSKFPVLREVHQWSCKFLCRPEDYLPLVNF